MNLHNYNGNDTTPKMGDRRKGSGEEGGKRVADKKRSCTTAVKGTRQMQTMRTTFFPHCLGFFVPSIFFGPVKYRSWGF